MEGAVEDLLDAAARTHEFKLAVPAHPRSLRVVRQAVNALDEVFGEQVVNTLAVIYSELVTNAIRHSGIGRGETLKVELEAGPDCVRGSVTDDGRGFDPNSVPMRHPDQEGGFGLRIVDRLASRWGVRTGSVTEVWFEL